MLFHEIGHKILADTMVDISQDPGRAGRNKNTSCPVATREVSTRSQIVPMTWRRGWHDGGGNSWNLAESDRDE